ncbi:MAG TPA: IS66 family transposase [Candidatus Competibacteraceae bacterium]|nr:IS66 family transposase [Candidatus Competibacteraceae bacterium]
MYLSDFDLQQLDEQKLSALPVEQKEALLVKLLWDLKDARERLKANSQTSSRPPRSDPPWQSHDPADEDVDVIDAEGGETESAAAGSAASTSTAAEAEPSEVAAPAVETTPASTADKTPKKAGRQVGAPGQSRQVSLPVSATVNHRPETCVCCGQALDLTEFIARTGLYVLEIETDPAAGLRGLQVRHEKHRYGEIACQCGHVNRSEPGRCPSDPLWTVGLTEWHLVGPLLISLLVCLSHRLHLSRRRIQELLRDWLGIELSTSTINQCLHEAGRAVEPLEESLVEELQQATLAYADETPWKEGGQLLWLWVIITPTLCLDFIGYRSKEILANVFGEGFVGWLMSDGYQVYRQFRQRLRCWAHLRRKAEGLKQSLNAEARAFGQATHDLLSDLMAAIYQAREGPPVDLTPRFRDRLDAFRRFCDQHRDSAHEKTRALAREFLNDWEAVWIVVAHPSLPLTNNEAERAWRHWVIARLLSQGTRTEQGSRAFALLASVIDTCRRRNILPWPYLAHVIAERRKGNPAPPLPAAA